MKLSDLFSGAASKFWIAVLGAVAETVGTGHFDWKTLVTAAATAAAVFLVPNKAG
jgi:hypothetical protein